MLSSVQGNEEDEETASPTLRSAMPANKRPPGRKQEKEWVKGGDHASVSNCSARDDYIKEGVGGWEEARQGIKMDGDQGLGGAQSKD